MVDAAAEFLRYEAWLSAKPEKTETTRREQYKDTVFVGAEPKPYAQWLLNVMYEVGLYSPAANGMAPITWGEIKHWQEITGHWPWLAKVVKRLSSEYVNEYYAASDVNRPSPLQAHIDLNEQRKVVSQQFQNIFGKKKND